MMLWQMASGCRPYEQLTTAQVGCALSSSLRVMVGHFLRCLGWTVPCRGTNMCLLVGVVGTRKDCVGTPSGL